MFKKARALWHARLKNTIAGKQSEATISLVYHALVMAQKETILYMFPRRFLWDRMDLFEDKIFSPY